MLSLGIPILMLQRTYYPLMDNLMPLPAIVRLKVGKSKAVMRGWVPLLCSSMLAQSCWTPKP
jgi:hypothetical protein